MLCQESSHGAIQTRKKVELLEFKMAPRIFVSILLRAKTANIHNNQFQVEKCVIIIEKKP